MRAYCSCGYVDRLLRVTLFVFVFLCFCACLFFVCLLACLFVRSFVCLALCSLLCCCCQCVFVCVCVGGCLLLSLFCPGKEHNVKRLTVYLPLNTMINQGNPLLLNRPCFERDYDSPPALPRPSYESTIHDFDLDAVVCFNFLCFNFFRVPVLLWFKAKQERSHFCYPLPVLTRAHLQQQSCSSASASESLVEPPSSTESTCKVWRSRSAYSSARAQRCTLQQTLQANNKYMPNERVLFGYPFWICVKGIQMETIPYKGKYMQTYIYIYTYGTPPAPQNIKQKQESLTVFTILLGDVHQLSDTLHLGI